MFYKNNFSSMTGVILYRLLLRGSLSSTKSYLWLILAFNNQIKLTNALQGIKFNFFKIILTKILKPG